MEKEIITSAEAGFIRFCRVIYEGGSLDESIHTRDSLNTLSEAACDIARRDMASACLKFLLNEGGVMKRRQLKHSKANIKNTKSLFLDEDYGRQILRFKFSSNMIKYLFSVYRDIKFDPADRCFTTSDGILFTLILDRIYPIDGSSSLLLRSGIFSEEDISLLITSMPFAQINFFDRLPVDFNNINLESCSEIDVFLDSLSALIPYVIKRWLKIESAFWQHDQVPGDIARLSEMRCKLSQQITKICNENSCIEVFKIFAVLVKNIFWQDFYDVERSITQLQTMLNKSVEEKLKDWQPVFRGFYTKYRRSYPPEYIEVSRMLDALGNSDCISNWGPVEVFSFLFGLPNSRVQADIIQCVNGIEGDGPEKKELVLKYMKDKVSIYMKLFFSEQYNGLLERLKSKFKRLPEESKDGIRVWISDNISEQDIDPGNEMGTCGYWMLKRRIRSGCEDDSKDQYEDRRKQEDILEEQLCGLIEERYDNISTWKDGLRHLLMGKEWQPLVESILKGYVFVESIMELRDRGMSLDIYDKRENAERNAILDVLEVVYSNNEERETPFDRYKRMRSDFGNELSG